MTRTCLSDAIRDLDKKVKHSQGRSFKDKTPVIGVKERNTGKVHAVVANYNEEGKQLSGKQLFAVLKKVCKPSTVVMTDQFSGYNILDKENDCNFVRLKIDHTVAFSLGDGIHTNGIESFWAVLKRGVYGVFHNVSVKYMQKYVNEFCYKFNRRYFGEDIFDRLLMVSAGYTPEFQHRTYRKEA